ncbi:MAG: adenylate/guanylate cyclase domain-containing protein [Deltaproteobacteria bacterium]
MKITISIQEGYAMNGLLLIDDEEGIRRSIQRALAREPYHVFTAPDGETGVRTVKAHLNRIGTVISDFRMPGIDGLETLTRIGKLNPEITRIILTGYATMEAAIQSTNLGIDGFLTKPFDNAELRGKIHEIAVRKHLRQFVPDPIYEQITRSPGALMPKTHEVSILFADIRGFTRMSSGRSPGSLVEFLNDWFFTPMGEIAYRHHGMVDKHLGDGMMVVYGVPLHQENDALMAVESGIAMQQAAAALHEKLTMKNGFRMKVGIGIATGDVYSGVLGSLRRKEYTSIGMAVNVAAKLQAAAEAGEILIAEKTRSHLPPEMDVYGMNPLRVKGMDEPIPVFRVEWRS